MKAPRTVIYLICIYSMVFSIVFIGIAVVSLLSYFCQIDFTANTATLPLTYMLYVMYFRSPGCHGDIRWNLLGVYIDGGLGIRPNVPLTQTSAVLRTFILSIIYLALYLLLFISTFRTITGIYQKNRNKHLVFWAYFSPFFFIFVLILVLDFIAAALYLIDFFSVWFSIDGLMRIMEIEEDVLVRTELENKIDKDTRSIPALIMFGVSSKILVFLTLNFVIVYVYFVNAWSICKDNQKIVFKVTTTNNKKKKTKETRQPMTSVHRIESMAVTEEDETPKVLAKTKTEKVKKEKPEKVVKEKPVKVKEIKIKEEKPAKIKEEKPAKIKEEKPAKIKEEKPAKIKEEKVVKVTSTVDNEEVAPRDETELPEIIATQYFPRITYQKQPSQEIIPLPSPPSFKNKRTKKTKF